MNSHPHSPSDSPLPPPPRPPRRPRRVLGPSRSPQPPTTLSPHPTPTNGRHSHSPSTSELSLSSTPSTTSPLVCPICSEEMLTLPQLNRHLDDAHPGEVEPLEKDDISSWFRKRVLKAKSFQPVAVLNQKLKGRDVFEPEEADEERRDPDFYVSRAHWTGGDVCVQRGCGRPLGTVNGAVNCRCCGNRYCEEHAMFQMKLSRAALHEPVRGYWCRVCRACYESREGYHDTAGLVRDHTKIFSETRRRKLDRSFLEVTRLEKRLSKLTQLLSTHPAPSRSARKALEQTVVSWAPDDSSGVCPTCKQPFSPLTLRKHHCRLCGQLTCASAHCSSLLPLTLPTPTTIRVCAADLHTLYSHRDFVASLSNPPAIVRSYSTLISLQSALAPIILRFRAAVDAGRTDDADTAKRRILDALAEIDGCIRRFHTGERLADALVAAASAWRRDRLLEVKGLSAVLESRRGRERGVRELKLHLGVLREQEGVLRGLVEEARRGGREDEVPVLVRSVEEVREEIEKVRGQIEGRL